MMELRQYWPFYLVGFILQKFGKRKLGRTHYSSTRDDASAEKAVLYFNSFHQRVYYQGGSDLTSTTATIN